MGVRCSRFSSASVPLYVSDICKTSNFHVDVFRVYDHLNATDTSLSLPSNFLGFAKAERFQGYAGSHACLQGISRVDLGWDGFFFKIKNRK